MADKKKVLKILKEYSENVYGCDCTDKEDVIRFQTQNDSDTLIGIVEGLYESFEIIDSELDE